MGLFDGRLISVSGDLVSCVCLICVVVLLLNFIVCKCGSVLISLVSVVCCVVWIVVLRLLVCVVEVIVFYSLIFVVSSMVSWVLWVRLVRSLCLIVVFVSC